MNIPKSFLVIFEMNCSVSSARSLVKCNKRFQIEQHCQTAKHQRKMSSASGQRTPKTQFFLRASQKDIIFYVVKAFLEADIPLYNLQYANIKKLIHSLSRQHCPSKSVCRGHVNELAMQELESVKELLVEKNVLGSE